MSCGRTSSAPLLLAVAIALPAAGAATAAAPRVPSPKPPACFGAAARDPEHPCANPALNKTATPTPDVAPLETNSPCEPLAHVLPPLCSFAAPRGKPVASVALIGDSHAAAWRAAVDVVATARRWRGFSITRDACPFTFARRAGSDRCKGWPGAVLRWLRAHPEVKQVIVTANSGSGVRRAEGKSLEETKIAGYIDAWKALPRSVRDVYVLRDVPHGTFRTNECVRQALARRRNPALRCARPRERALRRDLAALAAEQTDAERVQLIDLTPFMCDDVRCYPVVGGALVIKDVGHLTRAFSATLGPFLGRAIARLQAPTR